MGEWRVGHTHYTQHALNDLTGTCQARW